MNNLWLLWMCAMSTDQRNEEALYAQYKDRIHRVATRCASKQPGKCSVEELIHAGRMGLLHASKKFDPSKGEDLWAYAEYFVRGHILRRLEQASSVHEKLVAMFLRSKSEADESDDPKLYWQSYAENVVAAVVSLSLEVDDGVEHVSPEDELLKKERLTKLQEAVATLDDRERHVIQARYTRDESFVEIAAKFDLHDSVISKYHKAVLGRLRVILSEPPEPSAGPAAPTPRARKATVMNMRPKGTSPAEAPPPSNRET
jgi:RNA polymerase sigma factor for flagellar operon FliA